MQGWQKLKVRWGIKTNARMAKIWVVFAVTGSLSAYIARPMLDNLGLGTLPLLLRVPLRLVLILPVYQCILLALGAVAGEYRWFMWFLKKMWRITKAGPPNEL
jgi:hypothetical protein